MQQGSEWSLAVNLVAFLSILPTDDHDPLMFHDGEKNQSNGDIRRDTTDVDPYLRTKHELQIMCSKQNMELNFLNRVLKKKSKNKNTHTKNKKKSTRFF